MRRYLVVAHQTATSPELLRRLQQLAADDPEATFTLVVPATPVSHLVHWEEGEARANARKSGQEASELYRRDGLKVEGTRIGDGSPMLAIEDELRARPGEYDAIVLSTFPPGVSRWLRLDAHTQAERKFNLPVIHVVAEKTA